ncbi:uncharacterized protein I303_108318 [Kwoniella dejecticola CBS 10117]|uniref:F-box domain-containing protein n=1 Tax=Kwoniella dejecticola CBS 10117 TaxID=1296121 RepID=A0A1A5ZXR8_9TREE|nr:uncharacterized protein I303_07355 [Kwoniella dejecticola CBS 10117]OBR82593.1 hypothetical protein I303_07355 [Kwoniella dejecticola CBS 10117]
MPSISDRLRRFSLRPSGSRQLQDDQAGPSTLSANGHLPVQPPSFDPSDPPPPYSSLPTSSPIPILEKGKGKGKGKEKQDQPSSSWYRNPAKGVTSLKSVQPSKDYGVPKLSGLPTRIHERIAIYLVESPTSLRALSLTCRALRDPAQAAVWRTIDVSLPGYWEHQLLLNTSTKQAVKFSSGTTWDEPRWAQWYDDFYPLRCAKIKQRLKDVNRAIEKKPYLLRSTRNLILEPNVKNQSEIIKLLQTVSLPLENVEIRPLILGDLAGGAKIPTVNETMESFCKALSPSSTTSLVCLQKLRVTLDSQNWVDQLSRLLWVCPNVEELDLAIHHDITLPVVQSSSIDKGNLPSILGQLKKLHFRNVLPQHCTKLESIVRYISEAASMLYGDLEITVEANWMIGSTGLNTPFPQPVQSFIESLYTPRALSKIKLYTKGDRAESTKTLFDPLSLYWIDDALSLVESVAYTEVIQGYGTGKMVVPDIAKMVIPPIFAMSDLTISLIVRPELWSTALLMEEDRKDKAIFSFVPAVRTKLNAADSLHTIHMIPQLDDEDKRVFSSDPRDWKRQNTGGILIRTYHSDEGEILWIMRRLSFFHDLSGNNLESKSDWEQVACFEKGVIVPQELLREVLRFDRGSIQVKGKGRLCPEEEYIDSEEGDADEWYTGFREGELEEAGWDMLREWERRMR